MPHPFFDVSRWPAYRPEARALTKELCGAITQLQQIQGLYEQCGPNLLALTYPSSTNIMWTEVLNNVTASGVLDNLCKYVSEALPGNNTIKALIQAVRDAKSVIDVRLISTDIFVLDRIPLRQAINRITPEADAAKILLIRGTEKSGKSHAKYLFEQMALESGALPMYLYAEIVPTFDALLDELYSAFATLKFEREPQKATVIAWYQAICTQLQTLAVQSDQVIWIAMDDLGTDKDNNQLLIKDIKDFFDQFALQMGKYLFRKHFRLMLIHYTEQPKRFRAETYITVGEFKETDIQQPEIEQLLQEWRDTTKKFLNDEKIKAAAAEVIAAADAVSTDPDSPCRLQRIHDMLRDKLQNLSA